MSDTKAGTRRPADGWVVPSPEHWAPPLQTLALVIVFVVTFFWLDLKASTGTADSARFVSGVGWTTWRAIAAASVVVFVVLFVYGAYLIFVHPRFDDAATDRRRMVYVFAAAVLCLAPVALNIATGGRNPTLPVNNLPDRTRLVLFAGLFTAIPWFALAWHVQDACRRLATAVHSGGRGTSLTELFDLWTKLTTVVGAFACGVVAALVTSGSLRFAFLTAHEPCGSERLPPDKRPGVVCAEDFPATDVLLYGAAFALFLLAIAIPMLLAYRANVLVLVSLACPWPASGQPSAEQIEKRSRLEQLLHLDTPLFRNPLTLFSIFTPLVTSVLAAFIPQPAG